MAELNIPEAPPAGIESPPQSDSRGLLLTLAGSQFGLYVVLGAVPSVLLALQLSNALGDVRKAGALAAITMCGAVAHMVAQPLIGLLSDRTRSRWGSRTPWAVGGVVVVMPLLWGMGLTDSIVSLGALYTCSEVALCAAEGPLGAVIPDRVTPQARGRFGGARGLGLMLGTVAGQAFAGLLADHMTLAYFVIGAVPLVFVSLRILVDPDPDNRGVALESADLRALAASFKVSPRQHPDFWWAFVGRLLTYIGFFTVYGYTLYLFEDYVGLGDDAAAKMPVFALIAAVTLCAITLPAGALSDRLGRRKIFILVSSVGLAVAFMIPLFLPTVSGMLALGALAGASFGCYQAVDIAVITDVLPRAESYGQDFGTFTIASLLPQVLAPAVSGGIVLLTGGYTALFPVAAICIVLGGLAILPIKAVR
ncbi:MFS transporter [Streptomyces sp. NPDC049954]|uniref:MFS transporter n=1 Tax=Streptomyces sp. NPDC049954 TaxID=3155779 RepID=UPI0034326CBA